MLHLVVFDVLATLCRDGTMIMLRHFWYWLYKVFLSLL